MYVVCAIYARALEAANRRCIARACASVIAACAHIASAESPMHRKCARERHRNLCAHCTCRIEDASQVRVQPSSQLARTLQAQNRRCIARCGATVIAACAHIASAEPRTHRKLRSDNHCSMRAHCKRRIVDALQIAVRPSSKLARTFQAQNCTRIASCGATVIATCAHIATAELPMYRKCACDRRHSMRAHCKRRIADALQVTVRPSSQHARTSQAQNRRRIASCSATVFATCAHIASAESLMHCKLRWDRRLNNVAKFPKPS